MEFAGGCQCGRVRYRAEGSPTLRCVCYCRMCQRASGGPFMAFVRFPVGSVTWSNPPAVFASSNIAERGFCRDCGTPLTYHHLGSGNVSVTLNSLDNPDAVQPEISFVTERRAEWLGRLDSLREAAGELGSTPNFVSHQAS